MQRRPLIAALAAAPWLQACVAPRKTPRQPPSSSYHEPRRPQFHVTPPAGWMGNPCGLVHHAGRWHLFYQHHPAGTGWGPMHWGHASSADLLHWQHHPLALEPDGARYAFSGSVVVDEANSAGFGAGALVALYTRHDMEGERAGLRHHEHQHLAYSKDGGLTWWPLDEDRDNDDDEPVIPNPGAAKDFRDPKVFWHAPTRRWVAVLAAGRVLEFWASADLKHWQRLSEFGAGLGSHGGGWAGPDLFPLPVENGAPDEQRWVLLVSVASGAPNGGSGTQYFVGHFDGDAFTVDDAGFAADVQAGRGVWLDHGRDHCAGATWGGAPGDPRVLIAWMNNGDYAAQVPATTWRGGMTLPVTLSLRRNPRGALRLHTRPVAAVDSLRQQSAALGPAPLRGAGLDLVQAGGIGPQAMELELTIDPGTMGRCGVELSNARGERYRVGYDASQKLYFSDRTQAGETRFSPAFAVTAHTASRPVGATGPLQLRLFFDATSAELFADDGALQMTDQFFPTEDFSRATLFGEGPGARLLGARVHRLARVWGPGRL